MRRQLTACGLLIATGACAVDQVSVTPAPHFALPTTAPSAVSEHLFPLSGNQGYDVERYDVDLAFDPAKKEIRATANLTATTVPGLSQVIVDFGPLSLDGVTVDGVAVKGAAQAGGKLTVVPAAPIAPGARFVVSVAYHGVPRQRSDPSLGSPLGWISSAAGSHVRDAPNGTGTWLPTNDHPSDKAVFHWRVSVPEPLYGVASGNLVAEERAGGRVITTWESPEPMATYQAQVAIGKLGRVDTVSPAGRTLASFVTAGKGDVRPALGLAGQVVDYYEQAFGPYPFASAGLIVTDAALGAWIEAQARPVVPIGDLAGGISVRQQAVLSSALAHQWFGASVTPARWQDIWLSEGFSTYARWMWMQHTGLQKVDDAAANALARSDALRKAFGPPDAPTASTLYSPAVVDGGAVVLQALRDTVGDATFFSVLRRWVATYAGQAVTTDTFVDHVSEVVGRDMTDFFVTWLSATDVPDGYPATTG